MMTESVMHREDMLYVPSGRGPTIHVVEMKAPSHQCSIIYENILCLSYLFLTTVMEYNYTVYSDGIRTEDSLTSSN